MTSLRTTHSEQVSRVLALLVLAALPGLVLAQAPAAAPAPVAAAAEETYGVEVKIIEATQGARAASSTGEAEAPLDPALAGLAKDLKALPFHQYSILDALQKELRSSEAVTMQFGRPEKKRFLRVQARGKKQGRINLDIAMEARSGRKPAQEFRSDVSIPEGGTLVVVTKRKNMVDKMILLAISARTLPAAGVPGPAAR
ncbi:MAG: hypothetical protein HY904_25600 [Deltaproteobacteria bacterium]|nr:hypothetical protein [Deltaproteobacteria bacterium]